MKKIITIITFTFFASTLFAQIKTKPLNPDEHLRKLDSIHKAAIGKPYPNFEYTGDDGIVYSKKSLLGKKYYINFWFEGCHPCMEEMDFLIELNNKIKNTNNEFISFTFETPDAVKRIRKERHLNFKIICISQNDCYKLNLNSGFPQHIVVDENGNIEYIRISWNMTNKEVIKKVESLLTNN